MTITKPTDLLPHMQAYIRTLPKGLESYPQCTANVTLLSPFLEKFPALGTQNAVPEELRKVAEHVRNGRITTIIPETYFAALMILMRDTVCLNDVAYLQTIRTGSDTIADSPILKRFVHTVSPKLIMLGARLMWSTLHAGTSLTSLESTKTTQSADLKYEPYLFSQLYLRGISASLEAMFAHTKVKNPKVSLGRYTPTNCIINASWEPA